MSKAILIMDMPSSCMKCPLCRPINTFTNEGYFCSKKKEKVAVSEKPDWCPLKPMPEKQSLNGGLTEFQMGARSGYNLCIDKILENKE